MVQLLVELQQELDLRQQERLLPAGWPLVGPRHWVEQLGVPLAVDLCRYYLEGQRNFFKV